MVNALLLCLARENPPIRQNIPKDSPWLRENLTVHLRVLGPRELYREDQLNLGRFERVLGSVMAAFGEKHRVKMTFRFRVFDPTDVLLKSFEKTHVYTN